MMDTYDFVVGEWNFIFIYVYIFFFIIYYYIFLTEINTDVWGISIEISIKGFILICMFNFMFIF